MKQFLLFYISLSIWTSLYAKEKTLNFENTNITNCTQNISNSSTQDIIMNCNQYLEKVEVFINRPKTNQELKESRKVIQETLKVLDKSRLLNNNIYLRNKFKNIENNYKSLKKTIKQIKSDLYTQKNISFSFQEISLSKKKFYIDVSFQHEVYKLNPNNILFLELFGGISQTNSEYSVLSYSLDDEKVITKNHIGGIGVTVISNELIKISGRIGARERESSETLKQNPLLMLSVSLNVIPYIEIGYRWIRNIPTEEINFNPLGEADSNYRTINKQGLFLGLKHSWGKDNE